MSFIDLRIDNTEELNEVAIFANIIRKCNTIAHKPGLKNTFDDDEKAFIGRIAKGLGIEQEETLYE